MIVLFTDFGLVGPYTGQMKAVLHREAPGVPVVDLFADAPAFDPMASAYLLAAYAEEFPSGTVFLCVVDPGVGTARPPVALEAGGRRFVGPGNGLFELVARRAGDGRWWTITWRPRRLSSSFHGRDLFAPVAAHAATGGAFDHMAEPAAGGELDALRRPSWPDELSRIVYVDGYGNAMSGVRAATVPDDALVEVAGCMLHRAETFDAVAPGKPFWYENANGLVEIAVNRGRAAALLELEVGSHITIRHHAQVVPTRESGGETPGLG